MGTLDALDVQDKSTRQVVSQVLLVKNSINESLEGKLCASDGGKHQRARPFGHIVIHEGGMSSKAQCKLHFSHEKELFALQLLCCGDLSLLYYEFFY